ncbi:YndJ family protein [Streptomyces sp. NPDC059255]|uniref:YndJ family protein n=1 Tax=Streptomyces sp. NPDC059255 TaxID=3346793 RepID=UPI0036B83298
MSVLVSLIVTVGMTAIVPLGLRLLETPERPGTTALRALRRLWPLPGLLGAVSLWLPRGAPAAALAACYALATFSLALIALGYVVRIRPGPARSARQPLVRVVRNRPLVPVPSEVAALTALVTPSIAGVALVAERWGHHLFGFGPAILRLTVAHFHFAGFAAALTAGLVCRAVPGPAGRFAALSVPLGTLTVLTGYFTGEATELAGAVILTAGMWTVAVLTWRDIRPGARDRFTRALLAVSSGVLAATMVLALSWALGEATGLPHPTLTWMAATHGLGNALGFALCSILSWRRLKETGV